MMKKILAAFILSSLALFAQAQDSLMVQEERSPTGLRAEGKIYVVLAVALTILVGLFIYLVRLDRKIQRLENKS